MKAQELRIGNLIQLYRKAEDKEMSTHSVCGIENVPDIGWMVELEDGFYINTDKGIEPIPLTEEWLVKLGFEKSHGEWIERNEMVMLSYFATGLHLSSSDSGMLSIELKYVHQLQNLYFALTGEELTVK